MAYLEIAKYTLSLDENERLRLAQFLEVALKINDIRELMGEAEVGTVCADVAERIYLALRRDT